MRKSRLWLCSNLKMCLYFSQHSSSYALPTPSFFLTLPSPSQIWLQRFGSILIGYPLEGLNKSIFRLPPPSFVLLWSNSSYQPLLFSEIGSLSFWPQFSMASVYRGLNQVGSIPPGLSPPGLSSPGLNPPGLSPPVTLKNIFLPSPFLHCIQEEESKYKL